MWDKWCCQSSYLRTSHCLPWEHVCLSQASPGNENWQAVCRDRRFIIGNWLMWWWWLMNLSICRVSLVSSPKDSKFETQEKPVIQFEFKDRKKNQCSSSRAVRIPSYSGMVSPFVSSFPQRIGWSLPTLVGAICFTQFINFNVKSQPKYSHRSNQNNFDQISEYPMAQSS